MWGDSAEHRPRIGVLCSQQREPKSAESPAHGPCLSEQMLRMWVLRARGCPASGYSLTTGRWAAVRAPAKRGFPCSSTFGGQSCVRMQALLLH